MNVIVSRDKADKLCYLYHPGSKICRNAQEDAGNIEKSYLCSKDWTPDCYDHEKLMKITRNKKVSFGSSRVINDRGGHSIFKIGCSTMGIIIFLLVVAYFKYLSFA